MYSPWDGNSSLLCQADGERGDSSTQKMHFCPKEKKKFLLCSDSTGDKSHRGGLPQSTGPAAGEVSEGSGSENTCVESFNPFYERHHWSRGGGSALQAVAKGSC